MPADRGTPGRGREDFDRLERELRELDASLDYPPTPDLSASVRQRLEEEALPAAPRRSLPFWAVAAAVLAVFVVVPAISFAVFEPFGGGGMSGSGDSGGGQVAGSGGDAAPEQAQEDAALEEAPSSGGTEEDSPSAAGPDSDLPSSASGSAPPLGKGLGLGERISMETAEVRMGGLLLPSGLGRPDEVYATEGPTGNGVAFVYGNRDDFDQQAENAGFVLTELPGGVEEAFGGGAGIEEVEVGGERGVWVSGPEASGGYRLTEELGGSALFFTRGGVALRLESNHPRDEAIRLAESVE